MFVKLINTDNKPVWVNFNNVAYFRDDGDKTAIVFSSPNDQRLVVYVPLSADELALLATD
ncbi:MULTISPECIES: hypothetical protein [Agrobacterium]|uniref:Uncharacterized protein n=1 Tax=Agrobacterium tumefaciens TaxID=358 RepID=A0AAE6EDJ1_AGRTU|nr:MULTISPECIES: hypothetical protein [Agrobacterium]QCL78274.1 hypothetical protein CFBP5877_03730 [Agrobacterium tumefaciens]CUX15475.1 hypothetical protein AGR6A_Cc100032 [Agrobacterium sp. NCPPB 925]